LGLLADAKMYMRFVTGLPSFLHHTISLEEAKAIVRQRIAERENNFLRMVKRGVFDYPKSPYLPLLKLAGCEMGDIENTLRDKGLEGTLRVLRQAGVYVTFEEFKGREPIIRHGKSIRVQGRDFDNPYLKHYYEGKSGGTTGAGTRVPIDLDHLVMQGPYLMLTQEAHGVLDAPTASWFGVLPDHTGPNSILRRVCFGNVPRKWFVPITSLDDRPSLKNRLANQSIIVMGWLFGVPIPWPEPVPLDQAIRVARWAAETIRTHGSCLILTHVSKALRVCLAAREEGLNITGLTILAGGEPPTPTKVREITKSGAKLVSSYNFAETGVAGHACVNPVDENDIHFFKDALALIQFPRQVPGLEIAVDAFHFTSLLPTAPKLMLNVESDDYGVIEKRLCGCPLEAYGFNEHLRHIRSFRKLTGEGVTLVGNEMVHILEEVLPTRFGGSPLDYQLLEEEDELGFTRLNLLVSPKIKIVDEAEIIQTVLEALKHSGVAADLAQAVWSQAKTLRIKRMEPIWTDRGKLMPLHLARRSNRRIE